MLWEQIEIKTNLSLTGFYFLNTYIEVRLG
nr:MAG TPA: hypothetical protein [Caudoviricetes sp.]